MPDESGVKLNAFKYACSCGLNEGRSVRMRSCVDDNIKIGLSTVWIVFLVARIHVWSGTGRTNVLRIDSAKANPHALVLQGEEHCSIHWGKYSSQAENDSNVCTNRKIPILITQTWWFIYNCAVGSVRKKCIYYSFFD